MSERNEGAADQMAKLVRMARAALRWGVRDLARAARVSPTTVARLEAGERLHERTVRDIRAALEAEGVRFLRAEAYGGIGGVVLVQQPPGREPDGDDREADEVDDVTAASLTLMAQELADGTLDLLPAITADEWRAEVDTKFEAAQARAKRRRKAE